MYSEAQQVHDLGPATIHQEPGPERVGNDTWALREKDGKRFLVRVHELPRLALFNPSRATSCPVDLEELAGDRKTVIRPIAGGDEVTIEEYCGPAEDLAGSMDWRDLL